MDEAAEPVAASNRASSCWAKGYRLRRSVGRSEVGGEFVLDAAGTALVERAQAVHVLLRHRTPSIPNEARPSVPEQGYAAAMSTSDSAARLMALLGLSDEELCSILDADALTLLSGQLEHRPELPILLDLLAEAEERAGPDVLRRWVRAGGRDGVPLDSLLARDFAAFEAAVEDLAERGFVLRGGG